MLQEPTQETTDVGKRWLKEILTTMKGKTGQYLISGAQKHNITVAYADDLQHRIGEFNPSQNAITLELPLGIETATEEQFQEMVLTGRRVMYEELDHGVRHHERNHIPGLSAQESVDGVYTANEAIARITTYIGMSEDAEIGSAPDLQKQLGMPENGHAIYYGTTDAEMADIIISSLKEGEFFHDHPELVNEAFLAFYGTSTSEWYTLNYSSAIIPDDFLREYKSNVSLARVLEDFKAGKKLSFSDLSKFANLITETDKVLLGDLQERFENAELTAEAESLTLNDLIRFKHKLSQPDGGRANHLSRTRSSGNFFRDAPSERIKEAFDILINDAEVIQGFMSSCMNKSYLSEDARRVAQNNHKLITGYMPLLRQTVNSVRSILSPSELTASNRIQLEQIYRQMERPLTTPSKNRVTIYDSYVRGKRSDGVLLCP